MAGNGSIKAHLFGELPLLALAMALGVASTAVAQGITTTRVPQSPANRTSIEPPVTFDVISIRKSKEPFPQGAAFTSSGFAILGVPPPMLIGMAYDFRDFDRLKGLPNWCLSENYDIQAKVDDAVVDKWKALDFPSKLLALQALLASRFNLKAHREIKQGRVYELVIAKGGPKFKAAEAKDILSSESGDGRANYGQAETLDTLALSLPSLGISRPVVNKTELSGKYNLRLVLNPEADSSQPSASISEPQIIVALRDQLGLDLKPANGPIEILTIDHIDKPTDN